MDHSNCPLYSLVAEESGAGGWRDWVDEGTWGKLYFINAYCVYSTVTCWRISSSVHVTIKHSRLFRVPHRSPFHSLEHSRIGCIDSWRNSWFFGPHTQGRICIWDLSGYWLCLKYYYHSHYRSPIYRSGHCVYFEYIAAFPLFTSFQLKLPVELLKKFHTAFLCSNFPYSIWVVNLDTTHQKGQPFRIVE